MKILNKIWRVSVLAVLLIVAAPHKSSAQAQYISGQDSSLRNKLNQRTPANQPVQAPNKNKPLFTPSRDTNKPANDLKQKAQQIIGEQKAVREQRRDKWIRESQEQPLPQSPPSPSIYGQTPLQQQAMALRDQKRQLQRQQQLVERAKREAQQARQAQQRKPPARPNQ